MDTQGLDESSVFATDGLTPEQKYNTAQEMTSAEREDKLWEDTRGQTSMGCYCSIVSESVNQIKFGRFPFEQDS